MEGGGGGGGSWVEEGAGEAYPMQLIEGDDVQELLDELAVLSSQEEEEAGRPGLTRAEEEQVRALYFYKRRAVIEKLPPDLQGRYRRSNSAFALGGGDGDDALYDDDGGGGGGGGGVPQQRKPVRFTYVMLVVLILVFVWQMYRADWEFSDENPLYGPSAEQMVEDGGKLGSKITEDRQFWRLFSSLLLHAGVVHLVMNMAFFWFYARDLERTFGSWKVSLVFFSSGLFGQTASAIFLPSIVTVGVSAALFGLLGSLFADFWFNFDSIRPGSRCKYLTGLILSSAVCLALGLVPMLDNFSHCGGFLCGILAGFAFLGNTNEERRSTKTLITKAVAGTILVALFVVGIAILYEDVDAKGWCGFCQNISCVETSLWDCDVCASNGTHVICKPIGEQ